MLSSSMEAKLFGDILLKNTKSYFNPWLEDQHLQISTLVDPRHRFGNLHLAKRNGALLRKTSLKKKVQTFVLVHAMKEMLRESPLALGPHPYGVS